MRVSLISFTVSVVLSLSASVALFAGVPVIPSAKSAEISEEAYNKKNLGRIKYVKVKDLPAEAYELQIKKNRIVVKSSDEAGRFYAQQTLKQLAEADVMYRGVIKDAFRDESDANYVYMAMNCQGETIHLMMLRANDSREDLEKI